MRIRNSVIMLLLALVSASSGKLIAGPVGTAVLLQGCPGTFVGSFQPIVCTTESSNAQSGFGTPSQASFAGSVSLGAGSTANVSLDETAFAGAGVLKGYNSITVTSGGLPAVAIAGTSGSSMEDTLTIFDPTLNGTSGSLVLGLSLDATSNAVAGFVNGAGLSAVLDVYAGAAVTSGIPSGDCSSGCPPYTFIGVPGTSGLSTSYSGPAVSFTFGQPFSIEVSLIVVAGVFCEGSNIPDPTFCTSWSGGPSILDATDTVILDSLSVSDSTGAAVSNSAWSVVADSGLTYTANGIVPEPSSYILLGGGLGLLVAFGAWKRRVAA